MKRIIFIFALLLVSLHAEAQKINAFSLPEKEKMALLRQIGKEIILKYGPEWYREDIVSFLRPGARVGQERRYDLCYSSEDYGGIMFFIQFQADTGEARFISFVNGKYVIFRKEKPGSEIIPIPFEPRPEDPTRRLLD